MAFKKLKLEMYTNYIYLYGNEQMNNDCLYSVMVWLGISDIKNCFLVNKRFHKIAYSEQIFYQLFKRNFYNINCTNNFYANYKQFDILNNFLKIVGHNVTDISSLVVLQILNASLYTIPPTIGHLTKLRKLNLMHNNLESVPNEICLLTNLTDLSLSYNNLLKIPNNISLLVNLQMLNLCKNKISYIPESICALANLSALALSNNCLQTFPKDMHSLTNLRELSLVNNPLNFIPSCFSKLERLIIRGDQLHLLPNAFPEHIIECI